MNWQPSREMLNKQRTNHARALELERAKHARALQQEAAKRAKLVQHIRGLQKGGGITKKQLRTKHRLEMALLEAKIKSQENKRRLIAAQLNNMAKRPAASSAAPARLNSPPPPRLNRVNSGKKPAPPPTAPPMPGTLLHKPVQKAALPRIKTKAELNAEENAAYKKQLANAMAAMGFEIAAKVQKKKSWNAANSPLSRRRREAGTF